MSTKIHERRAHLSAVRSQQHDHPYSFCSAQLDVGQTHWDRQIYTMQHTSLLCSNTEGNFQLYNLISRMKSNFALSSSRIFAWISTHIPRYKFDALLLEIWNICWVNPILIIRFKCMECLLRFSHYVCWDWEALESDFNQINC